MEKSWSNKLPLVTGDDFISFLYRLKDKCDYKANEIIHVVEKPWRYRKEYYHFLEKGDEEE